MLVWKWDGVVGVVVMVKEEVCEGMVEVRMVSDKVMVVVLRLICGYAVQSEIME